VCVWNNVPSSWFVSDCRRYFTEYISNALMMGGSVEFSVLKIETSYLADPLVADLLYRVFAFK
jgi:hypothetical protein